MTRTYRPLRAVAAIAAAHLALAAMLPASAQEDPASAQESQTGGLQPGEAFVTRFAGVTTNDQSGRASTTIDPNGTVASIVDVRPPGQPPRGEHWIDEPQRNPVTAAEVGQVFGVALDDATPPNIYISATSAFGLHLSPGSQEWMPAMWGEGGGPGTIYKIGADTGFRPVVFSNVALSGRQNSGPALGNIAYDRYNKQLFVSDLETGMIHRISATDGSDLGTFDHGRQGRPAFYDAESRKQGSLPAISFNSASRSRIGDCPGGKFERTPECWNFATSGRRVWGVGVHRDPVKGDVRLYYSVWSSPAFGNRDWNSAQEDDKRNAVWSVRIGSNGALEAGDVRREFLLPDFFIGEKDIVRAGYSQPVSDITFSECGERPVMLVAERGGIRNLGLEAENPFAYPHEARAIRYELDKSGAWRPVGRYDVGYYDRKKDGQPFMRSNCAGGIAFGMGYNEQTWIAEQSKRDQFVWTSGDYLCSPEGPCHLPKSDQVAGSEGEVTPAAAGEDGGADDSQVHGIQGLAESAFEQLVPQGALSPYPSNDMPYPATGPDQSYLIDTDLNIDGSGNLLPEELSRNDATKIGDIAIYQICEKAPKPSPQYQQFLMPEAPTYTEALAPPSPPPVIEGHDPAESHAQVSSHGRESSHYRWGSHNPYWSHGRFHSHNRYWSHNRRQSHHRDWSHGRFQSHGRELSHNRWASHRRVSSHFRMHSHTRLASHSRFRSHNIRISKGNHHPAGSHNRRISHGVHRPIGSHSLFVSKGHHLPRGSHSVFMSKGHHKPVGSHTRAMSSIGTHNVFKSKSTDHKPIGSHTRAMSSIGTHNVLKSKSTDHKPIGSHTRAMSSIGTHNVFKSKSTAHKPIGSHTRAMSGIGTHNVFKSKSTAHKPIGSHTRAMSGIGTHNVVKSKHVTDTPALMHTVAKSKGTVHRPAGSHNVIKSKGKIDRTPHVTKPKVIHKPTTVHKPKVIHKPPTVHKPKTIHKPVTVHKPKTIHKPTIVHRPKVTPRVNKVHKPRTIQKPAKVHKVTPVQRQHKKQN